MKQDRLTAWLLAGLIACLLLLQGTLSAYARSSMAAERLGPGFIICAPSGNDYSQVEHPLAGFAHDCCSTLCQLACAIGPAAVPVNDLAAPRLLQLEPVGPEQTAAATSPSEAGLTGDARAPPLFSL